MLKIILYLLAINIIGFFVMVIDKNKAKKGTYRISEKFIFILSLIGGSLGGYIGMYTVRHKTKHLKFTVGIPITIIINIICIYYIITNKLIV